MPDLQHQMNASRTPFKPGDEVVILEGHRDAGDESFRWFVVDHEEKGRVTISPLNIGMHIAPTYVVSVDWIAPVGA